MLLTTRTMLRFIVLAAAASASLASPFFSQPFDLATRADSLTSSCSTTGSASCHNTSSVSNLSCFESPGVRSHGPSLSPTVSHRLLGATPTNSGTSQSHRAIRRSLRKVVTPLLFSFGTPTLLLGHLISGLFTVMITSFVTL